MKRLIVTADDFGLSPAVNRAVEEGWRRGILTGASLMVTADGAEEAAAIARRCPGLTVGLHLVLLQGRSAVSHTGFPSLTDRSGFFGTDPVVGGMRLFFLRSLRNQIRREIEAQCELFRSFGLPLTHLDGHLNIHLHPAVFGILTEMIPRYGIRTLRLTRETSVARDLARPGGVDALILGILSRRLITHMDRLGVRCTDHVRGVIGSGMLNEERIVRILRELPDGVTELVTHPSDGDDEGVTRWRPGYRGADELAALTSPRIRDLVGSCGISLSSYREIAGA